LYEQLISELGKKNGAQSALMRELLTNTEKIMLAKRLALIVMLGKGHSFEQISETLKISPSTIARFSLAAESGKYDAITNQMKNSKTKKLVNGILSLIIGGFRPIHAPRWKWLDTL